MSEEVKKEEAAAVVSQSSKENNEIKEEKDGAEFSFDSGVEELPEEIKQKLEKNKAARAKKKLVKKKNWQSWQVSLRAQIPSSKSLMRRKITSYQWRHMSSTPRLLLFLDIYL